MALPHEVSEDEAAKVIRYETALEELSRENVDATDAARMLLLGAVRHLAFIGFINAAMQEGDWMLKRIAKSYPSITDIVALGNMVRVRVVRNRLDGE